MNRLQSLRMKVKGVLTVLPAALLIGLGVLLSVLPQPVQAASSSVPEMIPSTGKDFWLTYMQNGGNGSLDLQIIAIPTGSGTLKLTTADGIERLSEPLTAGVAFHYSIPVAWRSTVYNTTSGSVRASGLHVTADVDITLYMRSRTFIENNNNSFDYSIVFPTNTLGTDYMLHSYHRDEENTECAIIATADGTKVTITPSCRTLKSDETWYPVGEPFDVLLNKGDVFQLKGETYNSNYKSNMSGTTIGATKPVAVFNGGALTWVPRVGGVNGDHVFEQALPTYAWGKRFVLMDMSAFPSNIIETTGYPTPYGITAMYADTKVYVNGVLFKTLGKGETTNLQRTNRTAEVSVGWSETPKIIETSQPVTVYGYMQNFRDNMGFDSEETEVGVGEPSMALIPDVKKGVHEMSYLCDEDPMNVHYVNVVVLESGVSAMRLNGTDVSDKFTVLSQTFNGYTEHYAYARLQLADGQLNTLSNASCPFISVEYSVLEDAAISEAGVATLNIVPTAPIVRIDGDAVTYLPDHNYAEVNYCNRHPGIHFTAEVDYPYDNVKWDLGEGAISVDESPTHQYELNVSGADVTHNVKFYVYHSTPITQVHDTDSVWVKLTVHPAYYDTLKTKVAAKDLSYEWKYSSDHAFGLTGIHDKGKLDLSLFNGVGPGAATDDASSRVAPIIYGKTATGTHKWTKADVPEVTSIFDSLVYKTQKWDCDSIFYLQLQVVPDIIINDPDAAVCQEDAYTWTGHAAGAGHKVWQKNLATNVSTQVTAAGIVTDVAGTFEIRDTLVSKVFPYPDSIHVMNLTVYVKPTMGLTAPDAICQTDDDNLEVAYTTTDANRFTYSLKNSSDDEVKSGTINSPGATGTLTITGMGTLPYGAYKLYATAYSEHDCHSVEASVDVTINVKPTLTLNDIDPQCYPAAAFEVSYDHTNATKVFYRVLQGETVKKAWTEETVVAAKKFTISTEGWDAATYTVQAYSQSADGCQSVQQEKTFTIIVQPTVTSVTVANACDAETATELAFTTAHAATYNYYIVGQTTLKATPVATTDGAHTADLDISMLSAGDYTLKIVANSATCKSDTVAVNFTIYPMPTATITSLPADLNACAPGTSNKTVNYTTTNASQIKWQLTTPHGVKNYDYAAVGSSLTVLQDSLVCPGTYKVKITGVKSAAPMNCEVLNPAGGEVTFTMYNPAAITLNDIAAVCAGNAVTSTYTAEYTDSYTYEVRRKTGSVLKGSGSSTTIDGTIDLSKTDTLPAGTYVLSVTATNTNNCGSSSASKEFVINPAPKMFTSTAPNFCKGTKESFDITFSGTNVDTVAYEFRTLFTNVVIDKGKVLGTAGKLTIQHTDTLSARSYAVVMTPISRHGCVGNIISPNFTVYAESKINTLEPKVVCFGDEEVITTFTATNAATYNFQLLNKNGAVVAVSPTIAAGQITIPLSTSMTAALSPYTMRLQAVSEHGCESDWKEATLTINSKPSKVTNLKIPTEPCKGEKAMIFTYNKKPSEATSEYWALDDETVTGTTLSDGDYCYRNVDVSALSVGTHKLRVWVENVTTNCESDPVEIAFTIHPLPEITLLKDTACCAGDATVMVRYESTNANSYTYTLTPGTGSGSGSMGANGYIEVNTAGLVAGSYTLTVTAQSEHGCTIATPKTATITINTVPSIKLSTVDDFCEGTGSVTINYTALTAATAFDYIVKSGTTTIDSGEKTGMAANGSFTINPSSWEPGDYTIELIAKANGCGSQGDDQMKFFTINPLPTISADETAVTLCEKNDDAVFTFTTKHSDTYSYWLSGSGAPTFAATDQTVPAGGVVTITWPKDVQKDGNFTLNVTAKNACATSTAATTTLKVNNKPEIISFSIDSRCLTSDNTVGYDFVYEVSADASRYDLHVWSADFKSSHGGDGNFGLPTSGTGTIHKSYYLWGSPLMPGDYKAVLKVRNDAHCESDSVVASFSVYPKPTLPTVVVPDVCQGKSTTEKIVFTHTYGSAYEYWIKGTDKHGTGSVTDATSGSLNANIIDVPAGEHTLRLIVKSENGCASDTVERNFTIHPWPTWKWISTESSISAPYPIGNVSLKFKNTNGTVASGNWNVVTEATVNGGSFGPDKFVISGTIPTDSLKAVTGQDDGSFTIDFTGVAPGRYLISARVATVDGCGYTIPGLWITIYNPTSITINHIDSICKGETPVTITINTTYADTYSYAVKDGNGNTVTTGSGTTTNSNATSVAKSFDLTTDTWEAGTYTITISATNSVTHATCDGNATFTINPIPELTFATPAAICENEEGSVNVAFTNSNAKTITYHVDKLLPTPVANIVAEQQISANGTIALVTTGWADGTYRIFATPTSQHGCVGDAKFTDLVVNNQPEAAITAMPTDVCFSDAYLYVTYTASTDARAYAFRILNAATDQPVSGYAGNGTIQAPYGGGSFAVDVHSLSVGTYKMELKTQTESGCTSVAATRAFSVRDTFLFVTEATICKSETYHWNYGTHPVVDITGNSKGAGVHTIDSIYETKYGCDSIYRLILTVGEEYEIVENKTVCENKPFSWRGLDFVGRADGVYDDIHTDSLSVLGCDSIFKLHLTVENSPAPIATNAAICYGESFDWVVKDCHGNDVVLMKGLTASTHQVDTLICDDPDQCNPIYELNLTVYPEYAGAVANYTLCANDTYNWFGQMIADAGTYERRVEGVAPYGCDSVYRVVVDKIVPEYKSISQTVCYGEPVIFNGKTYTNLPVGPQTLLDTIKSAGDCDSVYLKLNLTVGQRYYDSIVVTECDKYVWAVNGNTYNHSGIYREEMATVDGCDSVCVLNLTINPSYEFNETYDILNTQLPFTVHEFTYTAAGMYDREFVSVAGCDSIYHITLNVHELQLPKDTTTAAICAGATYTWQGNNYTAGGWYSVTENDGENDVAIHVLHLNVNPTYSDTTYVHSCGTYNWRGTDYSASGIYPVLLPSSCGCDSTVVLKLTVGAPTASTVNVTACQYEPTTVGNRTFVAMANTSFTETLTNAAGCDSVVTYNVTVTPRIYTSPEDMYSFCKGESYTWHGHTYDKPGTYYDSVADANGCTTIIHTLILTQKQAYHFQEDVEVSELALPYAWVGHKADTLLRTNGDYYDRWTSQVTGCDSIYHIHFHVNWVMRDTVQKQGCESVTWSVNGHSYTYTESGLYSDTLFTDAPANTQYDVIHFCDVTVHPAYHVVDPDVTVCQDELPYVWRGQTYSDLTVGDNVRSINPKTVNGCDSTFTITIHVVKSFRDEQTYAACPSELPYLWHGQLLTVAGDYTDAHSSITGCDSTYVLHFSVKTVTEPDVENQIHCQGEQIQWHGLDFVANEPGEYAYYDWYVPNPECPDYQTYHLLNLTVGEVYDVDSALTEHVCQGQTFLWFNADRSVTQDNAHKLDDHTYVETFHYEEQTVLGCDSLSANLTLYMHLPYEKTLEDTTVCNSYDWDGLNITTTGDYEKVYPLHGLTCADSVLHRHFTVLYSETETITEDVCDSYYWDKTQQDYTESGTYVHSVPQMGGLCDKVYTLNLTVRKSVRDTVTINNWCHEFTWAATGTTYHTSTIDSVVYPGAASTGCDSIAYLRLTLVTDTVFHLPAVTACETYTWADGDGMTYTGSTTARYATTSVVTGCDSIVYLPITINHPVAVTHNLEGCRTLTWNDETFTTSKTGYVQVFDCDSVVTLNVTIHQPDTIHHVLRACESLTWNNETYTYSQQAQQDFLCDSVVMLDITIDHNKVEDEYVTAWDSYTWEGDTYTTEGYNEYTKTLPSACGCDSVVTLHLTLNSSQSDEETQLACESFDWAWSGLTYTLSGDYEVKKRIDEGLPTERDSTRTLHLGIGHKKFKAETVTDVCDAYVWHGTEYLTSGTYTYEYNDTCDGNVDTLHLTLYHKSVPVELYDTACDVLTINGKSYFSNIDFTETLQTVHGCDSVVNYHLVIRHRQAKNISAQACGSYTWEGTTYTESGVYNKVLTGVNGCDSVVTLTLSIFPSYNHEFTAVGCGGHYVWDNRIYDAEGDYVWNYTSVSGCDSIVTMHLTMPAAVSSTLDTTVCDYIDWNGVHYTETGSYEAAFTSVVTGCDSIAKLHLNIAEHPTGEETVVEYTQAYVWGGQVYYQSGDYTRHIALDDGRCDSIATLHLTITDPLPLSYEFSATACDAYTWDSETFYESGVYVRNFPTLDDRDSIVKLTLTINHDTTVYVSDKQCVPYTWNDQTITESGVYTQVLERASGCDSVVTMTFISCERFETSFTAEARDVYTWEGNTYTESGEYTRLFQSRQGCDSLVTMYLTIVKTVYATDNAEACTQYAWADSLFTQSTVHTHIFPAATGGDSVVTMTLIIHEPVRTELFDTVREPDCSNPAYTYPLPWAGGESVQRAGIYTTTLASAIGCDSIVTLHLSWCDVDPCVAETSYQTMTACDSVQYEGLWYKTTGSYPLHYTTDAGCDSVHVLRVEIQPVARALIDTTACDSMYWAVTDKWYYQSGYDYDTLVGGAANGCDSITVMHVVIGHAGEGTLDITSCDALTLNGETFKESGTYIQHLTTVTGCDSTLTINLTLSPAKDSTISGVACDDTVWNYVSYTASGSYPQVLQTAEGCDSVVTLNLIIYGSKDINYIDTIHCDSIVWGPDREGNDTVIYDDGIYTRTFLTAVGCDSTVTMDLRLLRHDLVIAPDTQACDSFVWNEKVYFESGTYNDTLVSSRTGCDSITTMFIQIDPTIYVEIEDSVPPPFYLWPTENDTIWESGDYVDTVPSFITGCDSITTLHLIMTDSIILDPQEPVRVDTFGYCPGDTMNFIYNLLKGHPTKYILIFDTVAPRVPDYSRDFMSVLDTTYLENHGQDSLFTVVIPEFCPAGVYCAHLQLFDDFSSSEVYDFCIRVNLKGAIVSMWTDVIAINNFKQEYFGYQWYRDDQLLPGATKQYYSDGEDLYGWYRAKVQLADSSWVFTCEEFFDLRTDSLELIAYPTPAPVGQPVTIKAMGILLEKLVGSRLTITNVQGVTIKEFTLEQDQRSVDVELSAGLYIATLVTGDADDRARTANVKFTVF